MKYLMCNLKSHKNLKEILEYKKVINSIDFSNLEFVLFPTSIYLPFFYNVNYKVGSQVISQFLDGAHTGEILGSQLKSLKASYVLINHCEVEETNIISKIQNAFKNNIKVVLCLGRNAKKDCLEELENLAKYIDIIFSNLEKEEQKNIIIAFEPSFAVNKSEIVDLDYLKTIAVNIKKYLAKNYDLNTPFIYGGGINLENIDELLKIDIIDGYLIGNCANHPENIKEIAKKF